MMQYAHRLYSLNIILVMWCLLYEHLGLQLHYNIYNKHAVAIESYIGCVFDVHIISKHVTFSYQNDRLHVTNDVQQTIVLQNLLSFCFILGAMIPDVHTQYVEDQYANSWNRN